MGLPLAITLLTLLSAVLTAVLTPRVAGLMLNGGAVRKNYLGKEIPTAVGISVAASTAVVYALSAVYYSDFLITILAVLFTMSGMTILGLLDDLLGNRDASGFKGHISLLFKGQLTTGNMKALGGGFLALVFSIFFSAGIVELFINTFLIALFTNGINLMDLRPGRAGKVFLFTGVLLAVLAVLNGLSLPLLIIIPVMGSVLAFMPYDLSGGLMLGDAGSNFLGTILGITAVLGLSLGMKSLFLLLLIILHVLTEKYSLTDLIEKTKFLRFLDEWGRPN